MSHDSTAALMGNTSSSIKEVVNFPGDPATFIAGLCCFLNSSGELSLAAADGSLVGVSLGNSLSGTKRTSVVIKGLKVPILLTNGFTPTVGDQVQISATTGKAVSSGTAVNAFYASSTLTAIQEDGTEAADGCALIDFPGGL